MTKRISKAKREEAEQLLGEAQSYQTAFWSALGRLEKSLGVELESTMDLEGWTIDDLLKERYAENPPEDWEDCDRCGGFHPPKFIGDCRDDINRWPSEKCIKALTDAG